MMLYRFLLGGVAGTTLFLLGGGVHAKPPAATPAQAANAGQITASFHGLQSRSGYLRVGLYSSAKDFPDGVPLARRDIFLQGLGSKKLDPLVVRFVGLPLSAYVVSAFHERSSSGRLTQDFLGIPEEEWGMSDNPRPKFRAPRFSEACINLTAHETKAISITLHLLL